FSVFTSLLQVMDITVFIQTILAPLFITLQLPTDLIPAVFTGLFEITLGSDLISEIKEASTSIQLVAVGFILGFNGFSVYAQVASILSNTDILYKYYLYVCLLYTLFCSIIFLFVFN